MDIERARYLVSSRGQDDLRAVAGLPVSDPVALSTLLRARFEPAAASALAEQLTLQGRAAGRIEDPSSWLFTAAGLQMMTHPLVARRRAARLASLSVPVADLTCGLGGDLRAVSETGVRVLGLEREAPVALLARHNTPGAHVIRGDAARPPLDIHRLAAVVDPARREGVARDTDPAAFSPPWSVVLSLAANAIAGVVKGPPGIRDRDIPPAAEVEFVQVGRTLREAALWFGHGAVPGLRRAVHLPSGATLDSRSPEAAADLLPVGAVLFDPESCVTRAGLVRHLAHRLGASMLDPHVAYLTASAGTSMPLAAAFEVIETLPFGVQSLRRLLRERGWRPVEVRRRAFPVEPDELRRLLGRLDGSPVTLLCTTLAGRRTVIVGRHIPPVNNCASV